MTTEAEQKDITAMHEARAVEYDHAISYCRHVLTLSIDELKSHGHPTPEAAVTYRIKQAIKKADALVAAHIKKWPD